MIALLVFTIATLEIGFGSWFWPKKTVERKRPIGDNVIKTDSARYVLC